MLKWLFAVSASCIVFFVGGCTLNVAPTANTFVKAVNDLNAVNVNISGTSTLLDKIDLYGVTVGDVTFPYVAGGTTTSAKVTNRSGTVNISIDSAVGYVGSHRMYLFTGIPSSGVILNARVTNTVFFNTSSFLAGATITFETKVKVDNRLTYLNNIDVNGSTINVSAIDLVGITAGDVTFQEVLGGTMSAAKPTSRSGNVTIIIDSVYVHSMILGLPVIFGFTVTNTMTTTITPGVTNTVVFDETTASALIGALAKKAAK
jgi:hypothetical protein